MTCSSKQELKVLQVRCMYMCYYYTCMPNSPSYHPKKIQHEKFYSSKRLIKLLALITLKFDTVVSCIFSLQSQWERCLVSKNMELQHFREELDSLLHGLYLMQHGTKAL